MTRRDLFSRLAALAALPLVSFRKRKPKTVAGGYLIPEHLLPAMVASMKAQGFRVPDSLQKYA